MKLLIQDAVNYLISMVISILGILGLWVFWDVGYFGLGYFGLGFFGTLGVLGLGILGLDILGLGILSCHRNNHVVALLMSFLRVLLFTLISNYLLLHLRFVNRIKIAELH